MCFSLVFCDIKIHVTGPTKSHNSSLIESVFVIYWYQKIIFRHSFKFLSLLYLLLYISFSHSDFFLVNTCHKVSTFTISLEPQGILPRLLVILINQMDEDGNSTLNPVSLAHIQKWWVTIVQLQINLGNEEPAITGSQSIWFYYLTCLNKSPSDYQSVLTQDKREP